MPLAASPRARSRASAPIVGVVLVAFVAQTTSGCLSHQYTIPKEELQRLAELPPEVRGARVYVSQDLGERRGNPVEPGPLQPAVQEDVYLDVHVSGGGSGGGRLGPSAPPQNPSGWRGSSPSAPSPTWRGSPPASGATAWRGAPPASGWRGSPSGGSSSGGGGFSLPSGGGGGGGGDAWAVLVVAVIIGAAVATVVLAASEGMRFAGDAQLSPDQPIHVKHLSGGEHVVPLGALTREEAAQAREGVVMDDEGYGLRELAHGPIDRRGGTFRFELGGGAFNFGPQRAGSFASHIQTGVFVTRNFGLVLDVGLDGGDADPSCCVGPIVGPTALRRDSIGLQAELMPIGWGPLRLGAFAGGGVALAGPSGARETGGMAMGGARLELELTAHMALSVRAGASTASLPSGWSTAGSITGGLAIY